MSLKKKDIVKQLSETTGLHPRATAELINSFLDLVSVHIAMGHSVSFVGFGKFHTINRHARRGINPITRVMMDIPEVKVIKFEAGRSLKNYVRGR